MRELINPTLISAFIAVAEEGGFTAAARKLGVSKVAVSQAVKSLEAELQAEVFVRTTRKVSLTTEGELLLEQCLRLQDELEITHALIKGMQTQPKGKLRISYNPYYPFAKLYQCIDRYQRRYPNVKVDLIAEERMPDLQREQIDIIFGVNWPAPDDVVAKKIGKTRYVLCASPAYLAEFGEPKTIAALQEHKYIPHIGRKELIVDLKHAHQFNIKTNLASNNAEHMKELALMGRGIIQLHDYMVAAELADGSLVELLSSQFKPAKALYMYYFKNRLVQPKIREFVRLYTD